MESFHLIRKGHHIVPCREERSFLVFTSQFVTRTSYAEDQAAVTTKNRNRNTFLALSPCFFSAILKLPCFLWKGLQCLNGSEDGTYNGLVSDNCRHYGTCRLQAEVFAACARESGHSNQHRGILCCRCPHRSVGSLPSLSCKVCLNLSFASGSSTSSLVLEPKPSSARCGSYLVQTTPASINLPVRNSSSCLASRR